MTDTESKGDREREGEIQRERESERIKRRGGGLQIGND